MDRSEYRKDFIKFNKPIEDAEMMNKAGFSLNDKPTQTSDNTSSLKTIPKLSLTELLKRKGLENKSTSSKKRKRKLKKQQEQEQKIKEDEVKGHSMPFDTEGKAILLEKANSDDDIVRDGDVLMEITSHLNFIKEQFPDNPIIQVETLVTTAHNDTAIVNQKNVGACVAFSVIAAFEHTLKQQNSDGRHVKFSERQLYLVSRVYYDSAMPCADVGTTHLSALTALTQVGLVNNDDAPYFDRNKTVRFWVETEDADPISNEYVETVTVERISNTIENIKKSIDAGKPVIMMFRVPHGIFSEKVWNTGLIPKSDIVRDDVKDNHSVLCVGYDDKKKLLQFKNSWSSEWGCRGYGYIRYTNIIVDNCFTIELTLKNGLPIHQQTE